MTAINFYSSNFPEYFWQKGHYNLGNSIVHSDLYKALNPIRSRYDYKPNDYSQMPFFLGHIPQFSWVYGNLDYSFHKYHRHYQAHDDWYPDRKGKTLGHKNGGFCENSMKFSKYMTLIPNFIPRGCYKEIRKFQLCAARRDADHCLNDKLAVMEVCPDHVLEGLQEKKKWYLRAEVIDNQTYKRAMSVSEYNQGRSVSDLTLKTWEHGKQLRSDSVWQDDRYNPTKFSHPHRYDNVNFKDQEYKDIFGGTIGTAEQKEREYFAVDSAGNSKATHDWAKQQRSKAAAAPQAATPADNHKH
jgi:hypothetical protein